MLLVGCASFTASMVGCVGSNFSHGASHAARPAIQREASSIAFVPAPANMPKGVSIAVLEGDPTQKGVFTLRLRIPPGFSLPAHTHPSDERVSVLEGSVSVGFGTTGDDNSVRTFGPGSFYVNPPGVAHFESSEQGAVLQVTAEGPWRVDLVPTGP
jgi:quercetin dioxygenase-like cupin family protein